MTCFNAPIACEITILRSIVPVAFKCAPPAYNLIDMANASLKTLQTWGEMVKFSHSVFALPFALIATFMAGRANESGLPSIAQVLLILLCMVGARSFAMTFNRLADAKIDARNPRTAGRPLPSGAISSGQAWVFLLASAALFLVGCGLFWTFCANPWPTYLSLPTLGALAFYSYCKRFTAAAHFVLGAVIAFAPMAAWIAISPETLGWSAIVLTGCVLFWIAGFDIIYACQDYEVDKDEGLFSVPARLGIAKALMVSRACHVATVSLLVLFGWQTGLGWLFWAAAALTTMLLVYEQSLVKANDLSRVNLAFFTLNGVLSLTLGIATVADILLLG